ncbi:MAG TPA: glycerophosphodiester phosphodiesterase family protein [Pyrinomonadaceae bacterium]|nr:glycerophosphodiester phosphodiesterase family protein [Pyrinomonadaceae bacterium]
MKKLLLFVCLLSSVGVFAQTAKVVSIEGHRGARGYVAENTIPSFIKAIELGADTLELDVVISKDKKVVVSHEPWFSSVISLDPKGERIAKEKEQDNNIFLLNYSEIKKFDVGSIGNAGFPEQKPMKVYKPLLSDVFKAIDKFTKEKKLPLVRYNIEIKTETNGDGKFHPEIPEFTALVVKEILSHKMAERIKIQSFDVRPLQEIRKTHPAIKLALLVGNKDGIEKSIERLGFNPESYSPHFSLVDESVVKYCREKNIKLVPWTVNEIADLEKMKQFDLDGIITDYPDRAAKVFRK